jgi:predicted metal-binding protein
MLSGTQKVTEKAIHVNTLCETIHRNRFVVLNTILFDTVLSHQEAKLKENLGPRYGRNKVIATFDCPVCSGRRFIRKGRRIRVYKSALGKSMIPILQVQCVVCGRRFCPYKDHIGLIFTERISQALKQRQLELTCHISYKKAKKFIESCLGISPSPMTIRKEIDRQADRIRAKPVSASGEIVYDDSTKVKAGSKERGVSIHLAVTAKPGKMAGNRHTMKKRLMFLRTGKAETIKETLKSLNARGIVHDGDMNVTGCAPLIQRCLWHLVHQLKHFLWQDGLPHQQKEPYVKELIDILFKSRTTKIMKERYQIFLEKLRTKHLLNTFGHLKNAQGEIATSRDNGFDYHTTSPVEREMREINRRADIGVRWSVPGIENLLLVKTYLAMNKP